MTLAAKCLVRRLRAFLTTPDPPRELYAFQLETGLMAIVLTPILFILIGLALGGGGLWLVLLGGNFFYLFAGIMFLLTAALLLKRKASALWVYAVLVVVSLVWAINEVGFDWWQLGPRGGLIILLGLWLLTPWIRTPLGFASPTGMRYGAGAAPLALSVVIAIAVAVL